jgi:hypothetical protein
MLPAICSTVLDSTLSKSISLTHFTDILQVLCVLFIGDADQGKPYLPPFQKSNYFIDGSLLDVGVLFFVKLLWMSATENDLQSAISVVLLRIASTQPSQFKRKISMLAPEQRQLLENALKNLMNQPRSSLNTQGSSDINSLESAPKIKLKIFS